MYFYALFLLLLSTCTISHGNTLQGTIDLKRLQKILQENVKSQDITSLYYSVKGLAELNADIPNICETLKNIKYDPKNIEQVFQVANAAAITSCQNFMKPEILSPATQTLDRKDATIADIYHAVFTLKAFGKGSVYDKEDALKNLIQLLKKDDSPANYGYVFSLCEHMGCGAWTAAHAEGVLLAADESDARALHFDGGLPATATLLAAIHRTYKNLKKPSPLTEEQKYKFAEYLLTRRSVNTPKGACLLIEAANALADDEPTPISISIKGKKFITSESDSIEFSISDLVGRPLRLLKPDEVLAQSGTRLADDVVVLSKQPLTQKPNEPTTFVLNLSKIKAQYGLYKIALSAGSKTTNVNVAVLGEIRVSTVEVGVGDVDGTTSPKLTTVAYPNKLTDKLQADHLQKVSLKFTVRDKYDKPVLVQQAFVRVASVAGDETIFVAEPDNTKAYKVELNVGGIAKHLNFASGAYSLTIYLGDSAVSNPIAWPVGDVLFNFGKEASASAAAPGTTRGARPELAHTFRAAEPRPARLVSDVFAAACAAPLLLLLLLWARLGLNVARLPLALSALLFHAALGGVLALYVLLWLRLSMFDTARYVAPLAALTFLAGHRLLRRLARDKQR
ncbi:dolichyl-diphosphooligosaccharide--protein glycosyltransferase subunit 2 [Spodoptera frugiperda]|uniref:Dolichyl-diphosphooligosaccharide--protein glycosyltransferase subunit 2 n=1 Tax=Spodoptera frugiperda TaxID=7108 RepID=A0A9R0DDK9_SPOFR|nr:dolichyl-diphosphooligosaccharide--protein glycosyltransferase subunit 2 [Spodoptera frugiperda]